MSSAEQEPLVPPEPNSYEFNLWVGDEEHVLNSGNTSVIRFPIEGGAFDHIRHRCKDDKDTLVLFVEHVGEDMLKELEDKMFPTFTESELDDDTIGIFTKVMAHALNVSIAEE